MFVYDISYEEFVFLSIKLCKIHHIIQEIRLYPMHYFPHKQVLCLCHCHGSRLLEE